MVVATPESPEELASALSAAASKKQTITLGGRLSKNKMAGPVARSDVTIATTSLARVLSYEPNDLTISVEAGMRWAEMTRLLAENRQMVPLDPPFAGAATVGGVVSANCSGPRRRLYGTARDLVIGMTFATVEGKLVKTGGMVVKNVAGLDMGKMMIGSFGTLAAIAVVNFKLLPRLAAEASLLLAFETLDDAIATRDRVLTGPLAPSAIDLLNPLAAGQLGYKGHLLALQVGGNAAAVERWRREAGPDTVVLEGVEQTSFWRHVEEYTPHFLEKFTHGVVVRASCTLAQVKEVMASFETAAIARAGSGVCYGYFNRAEAGARWIAAAERRGWKAVIEFAPDDLRAKLELWPAPGADFEMMRKVKNMFDPNHLLNRGRLFRLL